MRCNLLDIPVELQLNIIGYLLQDEDLEVKNTFNVDDWRTWKEKQDESIKIYHHLINWSCTCSYFRHLLASNIFKTVKFGNDEQSLSSLTAVTRSPHNVHVKQLHFIGSALGDPDYDEAAFSDTERVLLLSLDALVADLHHFPSLERLSIEFGYCDRTIFHEDEILKEETPENVLELEASTAWRALMSRTYSALSRNKSPRFKHLEIRQLIWKDVSTFSQPAFHDFLSHFEQFTLTIRGQGNVSLWRTNVSWEYPALMERLDEIFFNHLTNVTTLSIKAPKEGPLGLQGMNHNLPEGDDPEYEDVPLLGMIYIPLSLEAGQMPLLTTLYLEYIFACPELIDFLVGHKNTLEKVTLRKCYACPEDLAENGIYWSELFISLYSACPTKLRRFELVDSKTPLTPKERSGEVEDEREVPDEVREVRTILRQDPRRKLFPYAIVDWEFGGLGFDEEFNLEEFWKGEDQASWNRLMRLMERNAKEATKRESKGVGVTGSVLD